MERSVVSVLNRLHKIFGMNIAHEEVEKNGRANRALRCARRHLRARRNIGAVFDREGAAREKGKNKFSQEGREVELIHLKHNAIMPYRIEGSSKSNLAVSGSTLTLTCNIQEKNRTFIVA